MLCWWLRANQLSPVSQMGADGGEGNQPAFVFSCSAPWCGDGNTKPEVREGRTVSCWQPVFSLARSNYRASCREISKHCLISKGWFLLCEIYCLKNKAKTLKHKMKCAEENTLLLGHPEVIQSVVCAWPKARQFLPFNLWRNCSRLKYFFCINPLTPSEFQQGWFCPR